MTLSPRQSKIALAACAVLLFHGMSAGNAVMIFIGVAGGAYLLMYVFGVGRETPPPAPPGLPVAPLQPAAPVLYAPQAAPVLYPPPQPPQAPGYVPQRPSQVGAAEQWQPLAKPYGQRIREDIDAHIKDLRAWNGRGDPLLSGTQAHLLGVLHSAISRHGYLIEATICEALHEYPRYACWYNQPFTVADGRGGSRKVQVDLIVFDRQDNTVRAYEIKRGSSDHLGSHTERGTRENLPLIKLQLLTFAAGHGFRPARTETRVISYYGKTSTQAGSEPMLDEHHLDEHFGAPVRARIEEMTAMYKADLGALLASEGLWNEAPQPAPYQEAAE